MKRKKGLANSLRFKATVRMVKPWSDYWPKKPTKDMVLEALASEILDGKIGKIFQIEIEELSLKVRGRAARTARGAHNP